MLREQPHDAAAIGRTWTDFCPHLETAFRSFREALDARPAPRTLLLYFDRMVDYGGIDPVAILGAITTGLGVPLVDGLAALRDYPWDQLKVSPIDGHLNALAHDIVARRLVRDLIERAWLPASTDCSDAGWPAALGDLDVALEAAGADPLGATARALAVVDGKWLDRRNRGREAATAAYQRVRAPLVARQRSVFQPMGWAATADAYLQRVRPEAWLNGIGARLFPMNAAAYAFEHHARPGSMSTRGTSSRCSCPRRACACPGPRR